ncbi:MAG TPA: hypothetical protein VMV18_13135 [bacterium]|nr:hypothetical protein [bacterium]
MAAFAAALAFRSLPCAATEASVTVVGNPIGSLVGVGGEITAGDPHTSVEVDAYRLGYDYASDGYDETGGGVILSARGRWYPQADAQHDRFWVAGGAALVSVSWDWSQYHSSGTEYGSGSGTGIAPSLGLGWKFRLVDGHFVIDPQLMLAYIVGTSSKSPLLAGGGVSFGWRF